MTYPRPSGSATILPMYTSAEANPPQRPVDLADSDGGRRTSIGLDAVRKRRHAQQEPSQDAYTGRA